MNNDGIYQVSLFDSYTKSATNALLLASSRNGNYCSVNGAGTADALQLVSSDPSQAISSWVQGDSFWFIADEVNTGDATVQRDGQAAKQMVTVTGSELPAGYLRTDAPNYCWYDTVNDWIVVDRGMEADSNSNGGYIKFSNGFCMTWHEIDSVEAIGLNNFTIGTQGWSFYSQSDSWTFPIALTEIYETGGSAGTDHSGVGVGGLLSAELVTTTFLNCTGWYPSNTQRRLKPKVTGTWYDYVDPTA